MGDVRGRLRSLVRGLLQLAAQCRDAHPARVIGSGVQAGQGLRYHGDGAIAPYDRLDLTIQVRSQARPGGQPLARPRPSRPVTVSSGAPTCTPCLHFRFPVGAVFTGQEPLPEVRIGICIPDSGEVASAQLTHRHRQRYPSGGSR